jgi:hypothetical protein
MPGMIWDASTQNRLGEVVNTVPCPCHRALCEAVDNFLVFALRGESTVNMEVAPSSGRTTLHPKEYSVVEKVHSGSNWEVDPTLVNGSLADARTQHTIIWQWLQDPDYDISFAQKCMRAFHVLDNVNETCVPHRHAETDPILGEQRYKQQGDGGASQGGYTS